MAIPAPSILNETATPIRRAARRFRWFKKSLRQQAELISASSGIEFTYHDDRLGGVFVSWLRAFEAQKPQSDVGRREYVTFAAGLMLRELLAGKPISVKNCPTGGDLAHPAIYWPEGYVYVAYCLNVRAAVLAQEFDETVDVAPKFDDIRTWWSFKENADEDSAWAIAFLEMFAGGEPNWSAPSLFSMRQDLLK